MQIYYYPRVSRRILVSLLDMFNGIQVYNYNTSGIPTQIIDVPIKFGPGEKYHLFDLQMQSGKKYYPKVPSLLLSLNNISYNSDRATSVNELRDIYDPAIKLAYTEQFWEDVQPAPYDYSYTLDVVTESFDHLFQIFENILPFFNPTNHLRIKEFEFLNLERDLRVMLDGTTLEYPQEMGEEQYRYFNGKISFTIHGYMYRPIDYSKVIKIINTNYIYDAFNVERYSTSALPTSSSIPTSTYNFSATFDALNNTYTKVTDTDEPYATAYDNVWDGGLDSIDITKYVFTKKQPQNIPGFDVGTRPDEGQNTINTNDYKFSDGTYADGEQ